MSIIRYTGKKFVESSVRISYGKCSEISNTFLFWFTNKILVMRAVIHKMLVRRANREYPDQTASASDLGLRCLSRPFWPTNFRMFTICVATGNFAHNLTLKHLSFYLLVTFLSLRLS